MDSILLSKIIWHVWISGDDNSLIICSLEFSWYENILSKKVVVPYFVFIASLFSDNDYFVWDKMWATNNPGKKPHFSRVWFDKLKPPDDSTPKPMQLLRLHWDK